MPTLDEFHEGFKTAGGSHMSHVDNLIHKMIEEIKTLKNQRGEPVKAIAKPETIQDSGSKEKKK